MWRVAQGETVTTYRNGMRLLLMWNTQTGERQFYNVDTDIFLTTEEYLAVCP